MADDDPILFDRRSAELIKRVVRQELSRRKNIGLDESRSQHHQSNERWVPFFNESGETIPGNAIVAITTASTYNADAQQTVLKVTKPSSVFTRIYGVNSALDSTSSGYGWCCLSGPVDVLYDSTSTSPAAGEGFGAVPGSWRVKRGWPKSISCLGVVSSSTHILHGTLHEIESLVIQTVAAISTGTVSGSTTTYKIMAGTAGSEVDAGYSGTIPAWYSRSTMSTGVFATIEHENSTWYGGDLAGNSAGTRLYRAKLNGDLAPTSTSVVIDTVVTFGGAAGASPTSATNILGLGGLDNDDCVIIEGTTGYALLNILHHSCT